VNISPLGACTLEATRHAAAAFAIDPLRCRLQRL
jgi:hypothetical protein